MTRVAAAAAVVALAGCGSSSSSTSLAHPTSPKAFTAYATPVAGGSSAHGTASPSPAALGALRKVNKGTGATAHISGLSNVPLTKQLTTLDNDLNTFWSQEFSNVHWPQAYQVMVQSKLVQTSCPSRPTVAPTAPWFLCDPVFFWTLPWIERNIASKGDVNLAFNVAEMWSFHVQNVLGFTKMLQEGSISKGQWAQQTMCLTGLWVRSLSQRNLFEQGDTQAARSFLAALTNVNGITTPDVPPRALQQAFLGGYNSGDPTICNVSSGAAPTTTSGTTT